MRIAMGVEYDGRHFCGWQTQENVVTVQASLEAGLSAVADHPVKVICAGRTDAGVHALGQVIHFDTTSVRTPRAWVFGTNANTDKAISVQWAQEVREDFHARFSARARRYRYVILNRPVRPTVAAGRVSWDHRPLDETRMAAAARHLLGEHDFNAYRATECQAKSPVREVKHLDVTRRDDLVIIDIEANAFLHHMVRNIAGVLMSIGAGEQDVDWTKAVLDSRDRRAGGVTAPPFGLYLMDVTYPAEYGLPRLSNTGLVW